MSITKHTVCLLALFAILSVASGVRQDQFRLKRQAEQEEAVIEEAPADDIVANDAEVEETGADDADVIQALSDVKVKNWVPCDWNVVNKYTCQDCNTRLICKPAGGVLKSCNAFKPYCRNGYCSAFPSDGCASK